MQKIGIITKPDSKKLTKVLKDLIHWLEKNNKKVFVENEAILSTKINRQGYNRKEIISSSDLLIVLGGDGTLLSIAQLINKNNNLPVLGINLGTLGFLSETTLPELYPVLNNIFQNKYIIDKRLMLDIDILDTPPNIKHLVALNEIAISKTMPNRTINIVLHINNNYVNTFKADGLIISTPTGSTAYSLSAGGPLLSPNLNAVVITPVCSHTLTNRPIVVSGNSKLEVELNSKDNKASINIDGHLSLPFEFNKRIKIKKSTLYMKLLQNPKKDNYEVLRTKLNWGKR